MSIEPDLISWSILLLSIAIGIAGFYFRQKSLKNSAALKAKTVELDERDKRFADLFGIKLDDNLSSDERLRLIEDSVLEKAKTKNDKESNKSLENNKEKVTELTKLFFTEIENKINILSQNKSLVFDYNAPDFSSSHVSAGLTINNSSTVFFTLAIRPYKRKKLPGIGMTMTKKQRRSNYTRVVIDFSTNKIYKALDEYGDYEEFGAKIDYDLSETSIKIIANELLNYFLD